MPSQGPGWTLRRPQGAEGPLSAPALADFACVRACGGGWRPRRCRNGSCRQSQTPKASAQKRLPEARPPPRQRGPSPCAFFVEKGKKKITLKQK